MATEKEPASSTLDLGGHLFPAIWQNLLPEDFLWQTPPRERRATCDDCYMVALGEYAVNCQCCTYYPQISNYMVGLALKDPRSRGAMLREIVAGNALPRELVNAPGRFRQSIAMDAQDRFGREHDAICPFFDARTTHCHIYPYRNSVCSTFTCVHDHGASGKHYWERLQQLVGHAELAVAQWALDEIGFGHDRYVDGLDALADRIDTCTDPRTMAWTEDVRRAMWGDYLGREAEFFLRCADLVLEHRDELYTIACDTRLRQAIVFEQAVKDWIPEDVRAHVPAIAQDQYGAEPIPSLNYKLQLATRSLWQLPFGEGPVALAKGVSIEDNALDDRVSKANHAIPHVVGALDDRLFLDPVELLALCIFEQPQHIDGHLLARPEISALPQPRESLAVWLRRGVLVSQPC